MRLSLGGYGGSRTPYTIPLAHGVSFYPSSYISAGFSAFDVICIGGGGGRSGGLNTGGLNPGGYDPIDFPYAKRLWGGAGGGGGLHRVRGSLADLPSECLVVVGQGGADEADVTDPAYGYPDPDVDRGFFDLGGGQNGGYSSFAGTVAQASGGMKGFPPYSNYDEEYKFTIAEGGDGGRGGSIVAGYGGGYGLYADDGIWNGTIGFGGKGGAGAIADWPTMVVNEPAGAAGKGSYAVEDTSVSSLPGSIGNANGFSGVVPGSGGGAKATPLTGLLIEYGTKAGGRPGHGCVIIQLT